MAAVMPVVARAIAATIPGALRHAEHALHAADGATNARADGAADEPADRTGCTITSRRAILGSTNDALRLNGSRESHECRKRGNSQNTFVHAMNSCVSSPSQPVQAAVVPAKLGSS
jgi:hypothetical protein